MATFDRDMYFREDQISKAPMEVIIKVPGNTIEGNFHVRGTMRLIDEVKFEEKFIAVTEATLFDQEGNMMYRTNFITLNRDEILWIVPKAEIQT
jgi:hypothetical protein